MVVSPSKKLYKSAVDLEALATSGWKVKIVVLPNIFYITLELIFNA